MESIKRSQGYRFPNTCRDMQVLENEESHRKERYKGLWEEHGLSPDISSGEYLRFREKEPGLKQ